MQISPPLPVEVYERPKEGPRAARIALAFPADSGAVADFSTFQFMGEVCKIQTLFVDNSANASSLTITTNTLQQQLFIPPNSQGFIPLLSTQPLKLSFASTGPANVTVYALNYSVPPAMWGISAAGSIPNPLPVSQSGTWIVRANQGTAGATPWPVDASLGGAITVANFPAVYPSSQSGAWIVGVNNFPSVYPSSQSGAWNVGVNNFPATYTIANFPAVQAVSQSGAWNVGVNNFPSVYDQTQNTSVTRIQLQNANLSGNIAVSVIDAIVITLQNYTNANRIAFILNGIGFAIPNATNASFNLMNLTNLRWSVPNPCAYSWTPTGVTNEAEVLIFGR